MYRAIDSGQGKAHWPKPYEKAWQDYLEHYPALGGGVYLHFSEADLLLYVGKAVDLGDQLGVYFRPGAFAS